MTKVVKLNLDELETELEFELALYAAIANNHRFEVLPIPLLDGTYLSDEEKLKIEQDCKKRGVTLLYRVSNGTQAVIFGANTTLVGIECEADPHGCFSC